MPSNRLSFEIRLTPTTIKRYTSVFLFIFIFASPLFSIVTKSLFMVAAFAMALLDKPSLKKREVNWIVIAFISFTPAILIDSYWLTQLLSFSIAGFYIICAVIFSVIIAHRISDFSVLLVYANVVTALTLISVILYSLVLVAPSTLSFAFQYDYYGFPGISFGLQNFVMADGILIFRNAGFASEPGTFQVFINVAAAILFRLDKMTLQRFLVLSAGIFTANSTAGLLTFAAIVIFASNNRYRVLAIIGLVLASDQVLFLALTHYESKFVTEYAFLGRFEPLMNALDVIQQYPLGFGTVRYDHFLRSLHIGSHDAYTQTLMRFGVAGFLFFIISLAGLARNQLGIALSIALGCLTNNLLAIPAVAFFLFIDWNNLRAIARARHSNTPT